MANILDYIGKYGYPAELTPEIISEMLTRREASFSGFFEIECRSNHSLTTHRTLSTSQGQDYARLLLFRVIEEVGEAWESISDDHHFEELIDAVNYLFAVMIFDSSLFTRRELIDLIYKCAVEHDPKEYFEPAPDLGWPFSSQESRLQTKL